MQTRKTNEKDIIKAVSKMSPYLKTAKCGFCKKAYVKHTRVELISHFAWRDAYIHKLRHIAKMTAEDRKKLVRFIKKHTTKDERRSLFYRLRYTYDFDEFWDERKAKMERKLRLK